MKQTEKNSFQMPSYRFSLSAWVSWKARIYFYRPFPWWEVQYGFFFCHQLIKFCCKANRNLVSLSPPLSCQSLLRESGKWADRQMVRLQQVVVYL